MTATTPTAPADAHLEAALERIKHCAKGNSSFPWVELSRTEAAALLARLEITNAVLHESARRIGALVDGGPICDCENHHVCGWTELSRLLNSIHATLHNPQPAKEGK